MLINTKIRWLQAFTLIMILCLASMGMTVYGEPEMILFEDAGSSPEKWSHVKNKLVSTSGLGGYEADEDDMIGPKQGNPKSFYYFRHDDGTRELGEAIISRGAALSNNQIQLAKLEQLKVNFTFDYCGGAASENAKDHFKCTVGFYKASSYTPISSFSTNDLIGGTKWKSDGLSNIIVPRDTDRIIVTIEATREGRGNLNVYLDNIKLSIYDYRLPAMTETTVTEIRDMNNTPVPLTGGDNWVNQGDTIYGNIVYNEPVSVCVEPQNLLSNIKASWGSGVYGSAGSVSEPSDIYNGKRYSSAFLYSHKFHIPLTGAERLKTGSTVMFDYQYSGRGPFVNPVRDYGGNNSQNDVMKPNIDKYNIKLDSVVPIIYTRPDQYSEYEPGRATVDIIVRELNQGAEQSPLTLIYYWKYDNTKGSEVVEQEKQMMLKGIDDGTSITYTGKINIPNGRDIPQFQDFRLYVKAVDDARNSTYSFMEILVRQRDMTPPAITWDKSIHEDGTAVDISTSEDTFYTRSRMVSFNALDLESGVEEIKYIWTKEPYDGSGDKEPKIVMPTDGKYEVSGASADAYSEGLYYLNIIASNLTGTSCIVSKGFYFDNEGPRIFENSIGYNTESVHNLVQDRFIRDKFLYTIAAWDNNMNSYETLSEPDISEGIKDDGMWRALEYDSTSVTERTASITGLIEKINNQTGKFKLVTRYYDEHYNCSQAEQELYYDFISPAIELVSAGEPSEYKKNHEVVLKLTDNLSGIRLWEDELSINWIDADSGEEVPASVEIEPQMELIRIRGTEALNEEYYLKIEAVDLAGNAMEEILTVDGSRAEYCFDNIPPEIKLSCNTEKAIRKIEFAYSDLKEDHSGISIFQYGLSSSPDIEPSEWIPVVPAPGIVNIVYPYGFGNDGEFYLHVMLQDALGNVQIIQWPQPFRVDVTEPSGSIDFESSYINKLEAPLHMEINELKTVEKGMAKAILSGSRSVLEDDAIADVQPTEWKMISFESGKAFYNWKLSDITDGEQRVYARFMDEAGNLSEIYEAAVVLDRTAPTGAVAYDITTPTTGDVTATITVTGDNSAVLLNNNHAASYIFNRNGEFEFVIMDAAGNKSRTVASVSNIDRDPPKASITYSLPRDVWTNQSITATLHLEDDNGYDVISEGGFAHTFNENGEFIFLFEDALGNQGSIVAEVKNIDKEAPVGEIIYTYSDTAPVTVYLSVYEPVEVTNNDGSFRYVFEDNGKFTFEFEDKAGNTGEATAEVNTITSMYKYVNVNYSDSGALTNRNIDVEFTAFSDWAVLTSPTVTEEVYGPYNYSFTENGDLPVYIRVVSGEEKDEVKKIGGSVYNIDRVMPEADIYISTEEPTNKNVTAILLPYDDKGKAITIENNNGESEYVFEENGTFTFEFKDEAGNTGYKTVTVSNIDKSTPTAGLRYLVGGSQGKSVFAEIYFIDETEEIEILNNNGSNIFEFVENGIFTFRFRDKAGNEGYATAQVTSLPDSISTGNIEYFIEGEKVDDPNSGTTNKDITAKLILDEGYAIVNNGGNSIYTFEQNGEYTFIFEDGKGNRGFATARVSIIDKEAPNLRILADVVRATNKDVSIEVYFSDNKGISEVIHNMEPENVTTSEGKLVYTCRENKTIIVTVVDTAGNETTREFNVDYIDKESPIGTIEYFPGSSTNQAVKAVLSLNEPGRVLNNNGKMEFTFTENGDFTFEFADYAGNSTTMTASVDWIDKTPPEVLLEYSNTSMTNKPVSVELKTDGDAIILNNGGAKKRTFYANGEFTFRVADPAGNVTNAKAEVRNIDMDKPQITLKGYPYTSVLVNESYIEEGYTAFDNLDGDVTSKVAREGHVDTSLPGVYILKYKVSDAVGNVSEVTRTVKVVGSDEIALILNGELADGEWTGVSDSDVNVDCIGNSGTYVIKWAEGKRTQAYFKNEGNVIAAKETVSLVNNHWYTFFVQDRERKTKIILVYINE